METVQVRTNMGSFFIPVGAPFSEALLEGARKFGFCHSNFRVFLVKEVREISTEEAPEVVEEGMNVLLLSGNIV